VWGLPTRNVCESVFIVALTTSPGAALSRSSRRRTPGGCSVRRAAVGGSRGGRASRGDCSLPPHAPTRSAMSNGRLAKRQRIRPRALQSPTLDASDKGRPSRYSPAMPKRSGKRPADLNRLAASIVEDATEESEPAPESQQVRAGRSGGLKGGRARAEQLSAENRVEIARKAARARWS
jgi:hypothetical protein